MNISSHENDWKIFAALFKGKLEECPFKDELLSLIGNDVELAEVIYQSHLNASLKWLNYKAPVLEGRTPLECLSEGDIKAVRESLMSMPRSG